jgi:GDP/UDP-N,N'-diacetylbacillosamine 2-epimerase (hydrolysing)
VYLSDESMRKIAVVTGSRAEYGLLFWILKALHDDADLELQLIVTGMHLSPEFGLTWQEIAADGFKISAKVEMLLSADTPGAVSKSMGLGLIGFADALERLRPDIMLVLGDRFEIFSAVQAAMNQRIPIAHIHGGELSEGVIDEAIRHAITKMAHLHFTSAEEYRNRVIQLGEEPHRVFNFGAPGLDNICLLNLLERSALEKELDFRFGQRNLLVTYHPVTLEAASAAQQFSELLTALKRFPDVHIVFTHGNADAEGRIINKMLEDYRQLHPDRVASFVSLGSLRFLSLLRQVDAIVGNSSSGLLEAPSFKIATVNIGDRQRGRLCAASVINCQPDAEAIESALKKAYSQEFSAKLKEVENPYGQSGASEKIKQVLKQTNLDGLLKKHFHDLRF